LLRYKAPDLVIIDLPGTGRARSLPGHPRRFGPRHPIALRVQYRKGQGGRSRGRGRRLHHHALRHPGTACGSSVDSACATDRIQVGSLYQRRSRNRFPTASRYRRWPECSSNPKEHSVLRFLVNHADKVITHRSVLGTGLRRRTGIPSNRDQGTAGAARAAFARRPALTSIFLVALALSLESAEHFLYLNLFEWHDLSDDVIGIAIRKWAMVVRLGGIASRICGAVS
jgi:hypothetical protein